MPVNLRNAHKANDEAIFAAYVFSKGFTEEEIVAELMKMTKTLLLKAEKHNWGLMRHGDWDKTIWRIYSNGSYSIEESFRPSERDVPAKSFTTEGKLTDIEFQELKIILDMEWSTEEHRCCDGVAWKLTMYDRGTIMKQRPLGYIYDTKPYEDITHILYTLKEQSTT